MTEKKKFRAVRGVRDILPSHLRKEGDAPGSSLWNWFEQTARDVLESYNFREIRLPIFEETELFARSIGTETDIVSKEMFTFLNQSTFEEGDADSRERLTLRPEATASVVRAYIEHGMQMHPGLVKLYYNGPMFRRERPQKGRYRQFYQIGAEVLGASDHPALDAELIEMLTVLIERSKVADWTLLVNSIGDASCRPAYVEKLREELRKVKDRLGPDSQRRVETNPLRVFDSKVPEEQEIIAALPRITDHLCEDCQKHFADLRRQLDLRQIPYKHEPRLVRGLDYYTRTTFEITSPHLGAQNALAGGGRYDGLSEMLGGPPVKGIGFALGEDRFIEVMQTAGQIEAKRPLDAFIVWMGEEAYPAAVRLGRRLRGEGLCVEIPAEQAKLRKALSLAERVGARFAVILGEDEVRSGEFTVKRMADGKQEKLTEAAVAGFVRTTPGD
ncbi:MAG TPA: histidine--tRNA ligase [Patescibacteria group bacterium]|nr:histidine--tRNA ligase [Patescibacteria group bacterium]